MQKPSGSGEDLSKKWFAYQPLRSILDVDTPREGYWVEKVNWHKRYINPHKFIYLIYVNKLHSYYWNLSCHSTLSSFDMKNCINSSFTDFVSFGGLRGIRARFIIPVLPAVVCFHFPGTITQFSVSSKPKVLGGVWIDLNVALILRKLCK
jgi:hypothetical protein